jgi:hypothetical protein
MKKQNYTIPEGSTVLPVSRKSRIPHVFLNGVELKLCCRCRTWNPLSEFTKLKKSADGMQDECRSCRSILHKQWQNSNIEKYRKYANQWYKDHPQKISDYEARRMLKARKILIKNAIQYLNDMLALDQENLSKMLLARFPCNKEFMETSPAPCSEEGFRIIGVLNGIFGVNSKGEGWIVAEYDEETKVIVRFFQNDD